MPFCFSALGTAPISSTAFLKMRILERHHQANVPAVFQSGCFLPEKTVSGV